MNNRTKFSVLNILLLLVLLSISCKSDFDKTNIQGKWKVNSWLEESSGRLIHAKMDMDFDLDGKYLIDYGSKNEIGKYWISGEYLHTIAEGQSEKKVKILTLKQDSLIIQMNRAGKMENVILTRE